MSLLPLLFSDWWEDLDRPHRIGDQHFGLNIDPEDLIVSIPSTSELSYRPQRFRNRAIRYHPFFNTSVVKRGRGSSSVLPDKDKFQVTLDVQQFHPNELNVKVVNRNIVVEAKHEEKEDEHGWISRSFTRKYLVPSQCDIDKIESSLSSDGVLTISVPRIEPKKVDSNEKTIKIQYTGKPAVTTEETSSVANGSQESNRDESQQRQLRSPKKTVKAA